MAFFPTVGLEVHAELKTKTKMFCRCKNDPDEVNPNANSCPVCMAHPGTLPTINFEAVRSVLRFGAAVSGTLADYSEFDRKNYFYPDIPKGYQISQYEHPLIEGGSLAGVSLIRVHLEEDTARSSHGNGKSLVDFNRAGVPLMELVTEPVIHDAETAGKFARELQLMLRTLGVSNANLEKGEMRLEANISVSKDPKVFGTKVEVKNLNSFRSLERAIAFEINRQSRVYEEGKQVVQETRGWDENKQQTFSQRLKEGSADYRYFPEPDLPKMQLSEIKTFSLENIQASLPELPQARRDRYEKSFNLKSSDIAFIVETPERSAFFDQIATLLGDTDQIQLATNYLVSDVAGAFAKKGVESYESLNAPLFAKLITLAATNKLSSRGTKDTLAFMMESGGDPEEIAKEHGLLQVQDETLLRKAVQEVLSEEIDAVTEYKSGKTTVVQYLVGKSMKKTRGAGNPSLLRTFIEEELQK